MKNFKEMLNNDKVVLRIDIFTDDESIIFNGIRFNLNYYSEESGYIRLIDDDGQELILPLECRYIEDEIETWVFRTNNVELYIYSEEIN